MVFNFGDLTRKGWITTFFWITTHRLHEVSLNKNIFSSKRQKCTNPVFCELHLANVRAIFYFCRLSPSIAFFRPLSGRWFKRANDGEICSTAWSLYLILIASFSRILLTGDNSMALDPYSFTWSLIT